MRVYNDDVEIMVLPDCAKCKLTGESPLEMGECPMGFFQDGDEDICISGECEEYTEEYTED